MLRRPWRRLYEDLVSSKCLSRRGNSSVPATIEPMVKLLFTSLIQNLFEIGYEVGFTRERDNTKAVFRLRDKYETTFCTFTKFIVLDSMKFNFESTKKESKECNNDIIYANMRAVKRGYANVTRRDAMRRDATRLAAAVAVRIVLYGSISLTKVVRPCEYGPSRDGPKGVNARVTPTECGIRNRCGDVAWVLQNESFASRRAASAGSCGRARYYINAFWKVRKYTTARGRYGRLDPFSGLPKGSRTCFDQSFLHGSLSVERLSPVAFGLPHVITDKRARHCRPSRPRRENETQALVGSVRRLRMNTNWHRGRWN
ncbi:hypothetical protein ALC57_08406 [Trachymyrmex cornetzi]|uniref:Uncharacterized protein n=1 Tax=Trachymyrmex cornetzi TaxID=471704 RepID=A0A195E2W7_9HYME|nr:hypothetical protein ALC57_08406 [Trachymyrmex cornetzi]